MRIKLTPAFIASATAEPSAERTVYWDATLPAFGLMVTKTGARSFVVQYRTGQRSRRVTISTSLKLADARKKPRRSLVRSPRCRSAQRAA